MSAPTPFPPRPIKARRDAKSRLNVIIAGAGLGGLGAAIAILLAGHEVTILEAAREITDIGAGIQVLPNASRVLFSWGLQDRLEEYATKPSRCNYFGWKGNHLSEMDFHAYARAVGAPFIDFHRADLHRCLQDGVIELGGKTITNARVQGFDTSQDGSSARAMLADGRSMVADLVVGADGINSELREAFLAREDPPVPTGDIAYRLLLRTTEMLKDPELRSFVEDPQVNYWIGPGAHAVSYVLRGGELFNLVLLVPDNIPGSVNTVKGDVEEMYAYFAGWDPRLCKLVSLNSAQSVLKWRLCIRPGLDPTWSHPSGAFTMLGDAVHATLPYLASGAGMAFEDGGVLGLCLGRLTDKSPASKRRALQVYEACRRSRTEKVVQRGTHNQRIYHLPDGPEQADRDNKFRVFRELDRQWLNEARPLLPESQETGQDPFPWRYHGVARWLLTYDMNKDVEARWAQCTQPSLGSKI